MFDYHMVQVPPNIKIKAGEKRGQAAGYLQDIVDQFAEKNWEFYGIEAIGIVEEAGCGCAAFLFGLKPQYYTTYVIVFRRPKKASEPN